MSHESPSRFPEDADDDIKIENYKLSRDFLRVAELLASEGMFNPERDRYELLEKLGERRIPMIVARIGELAVGVVYVRFAA